MFTVILVFGFWFYCTVMLLYMSGYTLCLKRTKSSCKVWKDKMLPFMAAETWNQWQKHKYLYCALMNLGFVFVSSKICHVLWRGLLKSMCAMGIKMMHNANISQYLVLVLCETGFTCAQSNTTCCKTVKSKSQKTCSGWRRLISCCKDKTYLANVLHLWIERDRLGFYKKADVGF